MALIAKAIIIYVLVVSIPYTILIHPPRLLHLLHIIHYTPQALLQQAVQTSTLSGEPHRESLGCSLEPHNLTQHLHMIQTAGLTSAESKVPLRPTHGLKGKLLM